MRVIFGVAGDLFEEMFIRSICDWPQPDPGPWRVWSTLQMTLSYELAPNGLNFNFHVTVSLCQRFPVGEIDDVQVKRKLSFAWRRRLQPAFAPLAFDTRRRGEFRY